MQLIFAALAAAGCIALGTLAAKRLSERERLLNAWEDVLQRMETRIVSGGEALPRLFRECARGTGLLFEKAAEAWETEPGVSALTRWASPGGVRANGGKRAFGNYQLVPAHCP